MLNKAVANLLVKGEAADMKVLVKFTAMQNFASGHPRTIRSKA